MKRILIATVLVLSIAGMGGAAEILLKNGNVVIGKILKRSPSEIEIEIESGGIKFPHKIAMSKVQMITETATLFKSASRSAGAAPAKPKPAAKKKEVAEFEDIPFVGDGEKDTKKPEKAGGTEKDEELEPDITKQIKLLIDGMITAGRQQKKISESKLINYGKKAVPQLVETLLKTSQNRQALGIVGVLQKINDKRATMALMKKLGTGTDKVVLGETYKALKSVTGQKFPFDSEGNTGVRKSQLSKWETWWESAKEGYPEQIGFEEKKAKKEKKPPAKPAPAKSGADELDW